MCAIALLMFLAMVLLVMLGVPPTLAIIFVVALTGYVFIATVVSAIRNPIEAQRQTRQTRQPRPYMNQRDIQAAKRVARGQRAIFDVNRVNNAAYRNRRRR